MYYFQYVHLLTTLIYCWSVLVLIFRPCIQYFPTLSQNYSGILILSVSVVFLPNILVFFLTVFVLCDLVPYDLLHKATTL